LQWKFSSIKSENQKQFYTYIKMKKYLILILLGMQCIVSKGQQYPMISQYAFNGIFINPAYTGHHKAINTTLQYRNQWAGFDGAPKTSVLAADGMLKGNKHGLGGIIYHDKIGARTESDFSINYAYHIRTSHNTNLSFGVRGGLAHQTGNFNELNTLQPDMVFAQNHSALIPKAGFGTFFYGDNFFAGFSIPTLLAYEKGHDLSVDINKSSNLGRHYLLSGGYVHDFKNGIKIKPTTIIKYLPNAALQADLNMNVLLLNTIWTGVGYRTGESLMALVEYNTSYGFRFGYAFDYTLSRIRNFSYGSHELLIGYRFKKSNGSPKTPKLF
jgi:type IX secretion system PorP/SprF family membrane protein